MMCSQMCRTYRVLRKKSHIWADPAGSAAPRNNGQHPSMPPPPPLIPLWKRKPHPTMHMRKPLLVGGMPSSPAACAAAPPVSLSESSSPALPPPPSLTRCSAGGPSSDALPPCGSAPRNCHRAAPRRRGGCGPERPKLWTSATKRSVRSAASTMLSLPMVRCSARSRGGSQDGTASPSTASGTAVAHASAAGARQSLTKSAREHTAAGRCSLTVLVNGAR